VAHALACGESFGDPVYRSKESAQAKACATIGCKPPSGMAEFLQPCKILIQMETVE
jgi:hypothetical protein